MRLRNALDLCSVFESESWVTVPGERPATTMLAGLFDPGEDEPKVRPLVGHSIAVHEPQPELSLVWPLPDRDEEDSPRGRDVGLPEWAEEDGEWKHAQLSWVVVLLHGAPVWQTRLWYLDWGSGVGGYVADFRRRGGSWDWDVSAWEVGLARLITELGGEGDFAAHDPTLRLVPDPFQTHPVDFA